MTPCRREGKSMLRIGLRLPPENDNGPDGPVVIFPPSVVEDESPVRPTQGYRGLSLFDTVFVGQSTGDPDVPACRVYQDTGIHYPVWINSAFGSGQRFSKEW